MSCSESTDPGVQPLCSSRPCTEEQHACCCGWARLAVRVLTDTAGAFIHHALPKPSLFP
jgi:hypothetical protein